jgi:4-amino-4-deoxy-L-arabinose transferase-like glycosyltransferase
MSQSQPADGRFLVWGPVLICAAGNLAMLGLIAVARPEYLRDSRNVIGFDSVDYVRLGRNYLLLGEYSRCPGPPYVPDILRTPAYPIFAGGLDILGGPVAVYLVQALLHVAACFLLFSLVRLYWGPWPAFWASAFLASDLMLAVSSFEVMSEPLFVFLCVASAHLLLPALFPPDGANVRWWPAVLGGGATLGLAILTRPAGLYLPAVYVVLILGRAVWRRSLRAAFLPATVLLAVSLLPATAWMTRNWVVFSMFRLSSADSVMLVYFAGGGAYEVERGVSLDQAQAMIAQEYHLAPHGVMNNHWVTTRPVADMDAELRRAAPAVLMRYPKSLVISSLTGLVKSSFAHNTASLARMRGQEWVHPGMADLMRGRPAAVERLLRNDPALIATLTWQILHSVLTWLLVIPGVILGLRRRESRYLAVPCFMIVLYFFLTVAMVGVEAESRNRAPHLAFLFVFAGLAAAHLQQWYGERRARRAAAPAAQP